VSEVYRAVGAPVQDPLTLSLPLSADLDDDAVDLSGDGLRVDPDVLWTFDFERAEQAGMAVRFSLAARDFELGFQRVLALGVKSSLTPEESAQELEALFDGHHYTRGLSFVAQGTPTNNTRSTTSGYPVRDPAGAQSFAIERGVSLARPGADGERFMTALGLRTSVADHIEGADRDEQRPAWAMATALWPGTLGYFLDQLMAPVLDRPAIQEAWRHFTGYVRARGAFPAFRVGDVPYALLPISSLYDWQPELDATGAARVLPPLLLRARGIWARLADNAPHVNRTNDPDADLLETLALDASTREVRVRYAIGFETQVNLIGYLGAGTEAWVTLQRTIARQVLDAIGQPDWDPRVLYLAYGDAAWPVRYGLITGTELTADRPAELLSETQPLGIDYIRYIRRATVEMLREPAVSGDAMHHAHCSTSCCATPR
jgi:hypothetical protein